MDYEDGEVQNETQQPPAPSQQITVAHMDGGRR